MGFYRQGQPATLDHSQLRAAVVEFITEREIADLLAPPDPFGIDDPCPYNPAGHRFIGSCGDVACVHCAKIVWR